jgi:hypothetical protein
MYQVPCHIQCVSCTKHSVPGGLHELSPHLQERAFFIGQRDAMQCSAMPCSEHLSRCLAAEGCEPQVSRQAPGTSPAAQTSLVCVQAHCTSPASRLRALQYIHIIIHSHHDIRHSHHHTFTSSCASPSEVPSEIASVTAADLSITAGKT